MAKDSSESKDEAATPRRLREARRRGQVAKSAELYGALSLLCTMLCVISVAPWAARRIADFNLAVDRSFTALSLSTVRNLATEGLWLTMQLSMLPLAVAGLVYLVATWLQTGPVFSLELVKPQLDRINPVDGAKRLFAMRSLTQFSLILVKASIVATAGFLVCLNTMGDAIRIAYADAGAALAVANTALTSLLLWCGGLFALLGLADLAYQRWQFMRDMRMSFSEIRREHKEDQGDGKLKSQRNNFAQEGHPREQLDFIHMASLILCDSSGRVIVLVYRPSRHISPIYLVRGRASFGTEILAAAQQHGIATLTDSSLVAALYPAARTGIPVSASHLEAVLSHIRNSTKSAARTATTGKP